MDIKEKKVKIFDLSEKKREKNLAGSERIINKNSTKEA